MLPDSTVMDLKRPKKKRKSDKGKEDAAPTKKKKTIEPTRKKPLKKKVRKKVDDEDVGSDLDLDKELHPLSFHIRHRRELVHQIFLSLRKTKVQSMLPEILKCYSLDEMEELCYEEIQVMSRKRITALLQGRQPNDISSSGTDDNSSGSDDGTVGDKMELSHPDSTDVARELPGVEEQIRMVTSQSIMGSPSKTANKNLEILELEMRARAIKKMLMSQQAEVESDDVVQEVEVNRCDIEAEILKHMAYDQPGASTATSTDSTGTSNAAREATATTSIQIRIPVHRRTASEMEPGELFDDEEHELLELHGVDKEIECDDSSQSKSAMSAMSQPSSNGEGDVSVQCKSAENVARRMDYTTESFSVGASTCSTASDAMKSTTHPKKVEDEVIKADGACITSTWTPHLKLPESLTKDSSTVISEGEISNSESEAEYDNDEGNFVQESCDKAIHLLNDKLSINVQPEQVQDIFIDQIAFDKDNSVSGSATDKHSVSPLVLAEINSALYDDVPSPGKFVNEPQVNVISQSTNEIGPDTNVTSKGTRNFKNLIPESSALEDSNGLVAVTTSVTSTDTPFQCSALNWSGGLEVNLDKFQDELMTSDDEQSNQVVEKADLKSEKEDINFGDLEDLETNRVPTPEITAQRYRSQALKITLELLDDTKKVDKNPNPVERNIKIYSSASTTDSHSSRLKSKSKSRSEDKSEKRNTTKKTKKFSKTNTDNTSSEQNSTKANIPSFDSKSKFSLHRNIEDAPSTKGSGSTPGHKHPLECCNQSVTEVSYKHKSTSQKLSHNHERVREKSPRQDSFHSKKDESVIVQSKPSHKISKFKDSRRQHSNDTRQRHHNNSIKRHLEDKASQKTKLSVFQRLSEIPKSPSHSSKRSTSPKYRSTQEEHGKRKTRSLYENCAWQRNWNQHSFFDDKDDQSSTRSDRHCYSIKNRSEHLEVHNVKMHVGKPSVVKTYDTFQTGQRKHEKKLVNAKDDHNKSPVRFPSPDITVVKEPKVSKPKPPLVVLSD
ncbi:uncharacterized protein [Watersipora subatra]|uniref:uncharacterized protein n=1 Tax=Watersipora subatra TaxID=2589382 RepID=UPI00355BE82D